MHIRTTSQKSLNSNIFNGFFVFKSLLLNKPAFIWSKVQQKQYNLESFIFEYISQYIQYTGVIYSCDLKADFLPLLLT